MGERYHVYKPVISRLTTWNNSNHLTNDSGVSSNSSDFAYYSGNNTNKSSQMGGRNDIGRHVMKYQLKNPLTALSSSPDQNHVIVAGGSVLKILNVSEREITEESNLNIRHGNRNNNITDVKWGNSYTKNKVATAATTGSISMWDVGNGQPRNEIKIGAHSRVVNRVCFHPRQGDCLLSASHDGTIKLWDLRDSNPTATITFEGKCESVRDVQFNPGFVNEFASAFDNGTIQKWDLRKSNIYERRLNAHVGPVLAIDWHSDGRTIASGGRDRSIKIWDMGGTFSIKPKEKIYSMSSVARVQWRPNNLSEIASCSLQGDNRIFVWNIKRPYIASFFFEEHVDVPTGFLWHEPDVLWSCSKDRFFIQQDIRDSHRQLDLLSKCAIGWSVYDNIAFAIEKSNDPHSEEQNKSIPSNSQFRLIKRPSNIIEPPRSEDHYQLQQKTGTISLPTFDPNSFSHLARNYISSGADIWAMCDHNAKIAWDVQRYRTAQTWKIVQLLYGKKASSEMDKTESNKDKGGSEESSLKDKDLLSSATHSKSPSETKDTDSLKDPDNDEDLYTSDPESSSGSESDEKPCPKCKRAQTPASIANTIVLPTLNRTTWDKEPIMTQLLDYYAEQGDVQMCVTLILVLGDKLKISEERAKQWFFSYIDLLHRFQLWCAATSVIKYCNNTAVGELNQRSTTIYTTCNNCFKPLNDAKNEYWLCAKCKRLNLCSLCHVTVKGLYTWCQGCSHGGHHSHMQDWFSCNEECPTGCGHKCLTFLV